MVPHHTLRGSGRQSGTTSLSRQRCCGLVRRRSRSHDEMAHRTSHPCHHSPLMLQQPPPHFGQSTDARRSPDAARIPRRVPEVRHGPPRTLFSRRFARTHPSLRRHFGFRGYARSRRQTPKRKSSRSEVVARPAASSSNLVQALAELGRLNPSSGEQPRCFATQLPWSSTVSDAHGACYAQRA